MDNEVHGSASNNINNKHFFFQIRYHRFSRKPVLRLTWQFGKFMTIEELTLCTI